MKTIVRGRIWKFGNDVGAGSMIRHDHAPWPAGRADLFPEKVGFIDEIEAGDILVAGRHWGRGTEIGEALENLARLGVAAVVADSFAHLYFQEGLRAGFPNFCCPGVTEECMEGDEIEFDLEMGILLNLTRGIELTGEAYTMEMFDLAFQVIKPDFATETAPARAKDRLESLDLHLAV